MTKSETKRRLWARRIGARAASGASRSAYCRRLGVHSATMLYWEKQLKAKAVPVAEQGFARIELSPAPTTFRTIVRLGGGMAVECEGWPDAGWLAELSRTMMSRSREEVRS